MKIPGLARVRRSTRWIRNRFVPGAVILLYHRVSRLDTDPQLLCVTPQHFAEQLAVLRKHYNPIALQDLAHGYQHGKFPKRAVVVTFDDGYFDNLSNAKPLLEHHHIPATVFITTGYLGRTRECWWDELDTLLLHPGTLPDKLKLTIAGKSHQWSLGKAASYSEEAYARNRTWNVRKRKYRGSRQDLYIAIHQLIRPLADKEQREVLDRLFEWAGVKPSLRATHRTLLPQELLDIVEGKLIDIGAHTVTHPVLSLLSPADQQAEIRGSKVRLEEILDRSVISFAYPYGLHSDYFAETIEAVKDCGFACATSSNEDNVWHGSDRFQLPRRIVFDWNGDEFARKLRQWFGG